MFASRSLEVAQLQHGHGGDEWHDMVEVPDSTQQDPERGWLRGRIFRCSACEDEIRVQVPENVAADSTEPIA